MIPKQLLIEIGTVQEINSEQKLYLSKLDEINRQTNKVWNSIIIDLDDENLVKLYKGIVIVEKELKWMVFNTLGVNPILSKSILLTKASINRTGLS